MLSSLPSSWLVLDLVLDLVLVLVGGFAAAMSPGDAEPGAGDGLTFSQVEFDAILGGKGVGDVAGDQAVKGDVGVAEEGRGAIASGNVLLVEVEVVGLTVGPVRGALGTCGLFAGVAGAGAVELKIAPSMVAVQDAA